MSGERLERLTQALEGYVDDGRLAGAVALVARRGKVVYSEGVGFRDREANAPMTDDVIFRIASQTKAPISVGVLMLQEEGRLLIGDPVGRYLPEYLETTVAEPDGNGGYRVVPAERPITIRDLLTHTAGISYGVGPASRGLGGRRHRRLVLRPPRRADRRDDEAPGRPAVRRPARGGLRLRLQHRRPRRPHREGQRAAARRLHARAHPRPARHGRHALLPARPPRHRGSPPSTRPRPDGIRARSGRRRRRRIATRSGRRSGRAPTSRARGRASPAEPASSRPPRTTRGSSR